MTALNIFNNESGKSPFHLALLNGHLNILKYIVTEVMNRYGLDMYRFAVDQLLRTAMKLDKIEIIKYFFNEDEIEMPFDAYDKRFLLRVVAHQGTLEQLKFLLDEKKFVVDRHDKQLLLSAAKGGNVDLIKYLVFEQNLTRNGTGEFRRTALHEAALAGRLEATRFFVETLHYKVNIRASFGETPAHLAAQEGSLPVLRYLIDEKHADLNAETKTGNSLLHYAAANGHLAIVEYLVDEKRMNIELTNDFSSTPLQAAVREGHLHVIKYLVEEKRANVNTRNKDGKCLLHLAVYSRNLNVIKYLAIDRGMFNLIEEVDNTNYWTPALEAASLGEVAVLKYLIEDLRADIEFLDYKGRNLLHIASMKGEFPIIKYLVEEKGFDVKAKTFSGETVYDLAKKGVELTGRDYNKILEYLRKKMNE